ncbi:Cullin-domain-containing protein [Favolaschia claudopus]|uniref:Cullin-domain-containing protein n=1 Tax=Favolaschia claudopus TaxID=2862362 RepID=A0AAW0E331_9AGAR
MQQIWHTQLAPIVTSLMQTEHCLSTSDHSAVYTAIYNTIMMDPEHGGQYLHDQLSAFYTAYTLRVYEAGQSYNAPGAPKDNRSILDYYDTEWDWFSRRVAVVDRLFNYLNRDWVKVQQYEGRRDIKTVMNVAVTQWKINIFDRLSSRLAATFPLPAEESEKTRVDVLRVKFASDNLRPGDLPRMLVSSAVSSDGASCGSS